MKKIQIEKEIKVFLYADDTLTYETLKMPLKTLNADKHIQHLQKMRLGNL